jgi:hypothetical protein
MDLRQLPGAATLWRRGGGWDEPAGNMLEHSDRNPN